jgi:hypothetical protein
MNRVNVHLRIGMVPETVFDLARTAGTASVEGLDLACCL